MKSIDIQGIKYIELVSGTDEWYWGMDYIHGDLYEAEELFRQGHPIQSNRLYLIHYPGGTVYEPVPPVDGQYLGYPVYDNDAVALLVVNFLQSTIRILRFNPRWREMQEVVCLPLSAVKDCYNLTLQTTPLSLTRQANDNSFELIWPEQVCFAIGDTENLDFRDGDKLYFNVWYEDLEYWEETIARSLYDGRILEKFSGSVRIMPNGEKWLLK